MTSISNSTVNGWIKTMAEQLETLLADDLENCLMIGIRTGGVRVAEQLHKQLALAKPLGELNISFYRDDFSRVGLHPTVGASKLSEDVSERTIILVDDVIYSGRTIRAAMNEIFDFGRPAKIRLAALIERQGRELPIRADVIGQSMDLKTSEQVKLQKDLSLLITTSSDRGDAEQ